MKKIQKVKGTETVEERVVTEVDELSGKAEPRKLLAILLFFQNTLSVLLGRCCCRLWSWLRSVGNAHVRLQGPSIYPLCPHPTHPAPAPTLNLSSYPLTLWLPLGLLVLKILSCSLPMMSDYCDSVTPPF